MNKKIENSIYALIIISLTVCFVVYVHNKTGVFRDNPYKKQVAFYSQKYSVDPLLVEAVMKRESNLNPNAVSNKGAVGLMQIMPKTAEDIAKQLALEDYNENRLFEPDLNIGFGAYYLQFLMNYYKNNLILALAAYNAGIGNVDAWIAANPFIAKSVACIPYKETKRHTKAIIFTHNVYKGAGKLKGLMKNKTA